MVSKARAFGVVLTLLVLAGCDRPKELSAPEFRPVPGAESQGSRWVGSLDGGWEEWPAGDGCNWCRRQGANVGVAQCTSLSCDGEAGGTDDRLLYTGHVGSGSSGP